MLPVGAVVLPPVREIVHSDLGLLHLKMFSVPDIRHNLTAFLFI